MTGQLGLERTPTEFVDNLVEVFREVRRVLKNDGTLWLNLGDTYAGGGRGGIGEKSTLQGGQENQNQSRKTFRRDKEAIFPTTKRLHGLKPKDLVGIPWRVALALRDEGWFLRSEIIWHKSNCLPESVTDRPTKAHEHIFLLTKSPNYYYDVDATREPHSKDSLRPTKRKFVYKHKPPGQAAHTLTPDGFCHEKGKNKRTVWKVSTKPFKGAHFATFPPDLIEPCIKAGTRPGDVVLDPFLGSGTTGLVAQNLARDWIGIELNPAYCEIARERIGLDAHFQIGVGG